MIRPAHSSVWVRTPGGLWHPVHHRVHNEILDGGLGDVANAVYGGASLSPYNVIALGCSSQPVATSDSGCISPLMLSAAAPTTPLRKRASGGGNMSQGGGAFSLQLAALFLASEIATAILPTGGVKQLFETAVHNSLVAGRALHRFVYPSPLLLSSGLDITIVIDIDV